MDGAAAARRAVRPVALATAAALLACTAYFFGLGGAHIPKNGDESAYANVTRTTAATGHWLPLQSDYPALRNTKPPLLFWQGIASTDHGRDWTPWNLRYPCVLYTLATALMVWLLARKFSASRQRGLTAALAYLAFFSTFRYGRPFLTDAPETFWLTLACFIVLYFRSRVSATRGGALLIGACVGIGLLYKSFALAFPVALCLCGWQLHRRGYRAGAFLREDAPNVAVTILVALAIFGAWFAVDPDPAAVWRDFVVHENAGKFDAQGASYWGRLLWGGSSLWTMILGIPIDAGLLALPVAAMMFDAVRQRRRLAEEEKLLWIWVLAMLLAFSLPSQRSARYLIPVMPAIGVLCGLSWDRVSRAWFVATLALCAAAVALLAREAVLLQRALAAHDLYPIWYWVLLGVTGAVCLAGILRPAASRPFVPVAVLLGYVAMSGFLLPFDGPRGRFGEQAGQAAFGRDVWVPTDVQASEEGYRFLLPGAHIRTYPAAGAAGVADPARVAELADRYPVFTVRERLGAPACGACRVVGERLDLRGRLSSADIQAILRGQLFDTVVLQERLIASSPPGGR